MDSATSIPTFYLIAAAALGAVVAALSIALVLSRHRFWDWAHAQSLRRIMRDSVKAGEVKEFRARRSR